MQDSIGSRRKQLKPARLTDDGSPLASGTMLGPFAVRPSLDSDSVHNRFTVQDVTGRKHEWTIDDDEEDSVLRRVTMANCLQSANCLLILNGHSLRLVLTKPVQNVADLRAVFVPEDLSSNKSQIRLPEDVSSNKRFICERCRMASFSNVENLEAHQTHYCKSSSSSSAVSYLDAINAAISTIQPQSMTGQPSSRSMNGQPSSRSMMGQPSSRSLSSSSSSSGSVTNTVFLPITFHELDESVQILGPPQVVIPVAVARNSPALPHFLLLDRCLVQGLRVPSSIAFAESGLTVPLVINSTDSPSSNSPNIISRSCKRRASSSEKPLDLSSGINRSEEHTISLNPDKPFKANRSEEHTISPNPDKPFNCECGVAFSSAKTLDGHRRFYCKATLPNGQESREKDPVPTSMMQRVPSQCAHCDFQPGTSSQLAAHLRSVHSAIQGFRCRICGYKGWSIRGIKGHMKSHERDDNNDLVNQLSIDQLMLKHVESITPMRNVIVNREKEIRRGVEVKEEEGEC